jgi:hypothetical protein
VTSVINGNIGDIFLALKVAKYAGVAIIKIISLVMNAAKLKEYLKLGGLSLIPIVPIVLNK